MIDLWSKKKLKKNKASEALLVRHCLHCTDFLVCEALWNELDVLVKEKMMRGA